MNLSHAIVSKLIVSRNSHAAIDLRDNRFVETLIIGDSFRGSLNFPAPIYKTSNSEITVAAIFSASIAANALK